MNAPTMEFGFSPCPNDTFAFHALTHGLIDSPLPRLVPHLADVERLNQLALTGRLPLSKLSFHALGHVLDRYVLLRAGAALGRGCGPLVVARPGFDPADLSGFHSDKGVGAFAWGFTNPVYVDVDGGGFTAKYVREGISPVR